MSYIYPTITRDELSNMVGVDLDSKYDILCPIVILIKWDVLHHVESEEEVSEKGVKVFVSHYIQDKETGDEFVQGMGGKLFTLVK